MSTLKSDYEAALLRNEPFDCTGKAWACYAAKNAALKKEFPTTYENTASGHSPRVSQYVRERNSLDDELHAFSSELWEKRWNRLRELEGEPQCEIVCPEEKLKQLCSQAADEIITRLGVSFDSDEFKAEAGALIMECSPKAGGPPGKVAGDGALEVANSSVSGGNFGPVYCFN